VGGFGRPLIGMNFGNSAMKITVWQRLDFVARNLAPLSITVVFVIVGVMPTRLPGASYIGPALVLMSVYYWSLHRSDLLPVASVFVIGLLLDILSGAPLGLNTVILISVYGVCITQRRFFYGKSFLVVWFGFASISAAAMVMGWLLMSVFVEGFVNPKPAIFEYMMTVLFYPPVAWLFSQIHRLVHRH
jgi:rod shape-determining protein MreD